MTTVYLDPPEGHEGFTPRTIEAVAVRGIFAYGQGNASVGYEAKDTGGAWHCIYKKNNPKLPKISKPTHETRGTIWHRVGRVWYSDEIAI